MSGFNASPYAESRQEEAEETSLGSRLMEHFIHVGPGFRVGNVMRTRLQAG